MGGFGQTNAESQAYLNGPCFGSPQNVRTEHATSANVKYSGFKYGEIGSTCPDCPPPPVPPERTTSTKATMPPPTTTMVMTTTTSTKPLPKLPYFFRTPWFISMVAFSGLGLVLYAIYLDLSSRGWEISMPGAREPMTYA